MHEKRIIHRDLKPANILIFSDGSLKLGDLGLGRYMSDETFKAFSKVGTPLYMSPEVIRNDGYDFKSDVWSLGCVFYELITFKSPFRTDEKISLFDLFNKINKGDYPKITDEKYSNLIKDLVDQMMKVNPEERISLEDTIKSCESILKSQDEKPRIDPFIVMEDICEKLRLIDYENSFCKKYRKEVVSKFFFACNCNLNSGGAAGSGSGSKPTTPNSNSHNSNIPNNSNINSQFIYFYELCNWLLLLIKQVIIFF
jgi:serine/threonine protein kinase